MRRQICGHGCDNYRVESAGKFKVGNRHALGEGFRENIRESDYPGLDILPSNLAYRHLDIQFNRMKKPRKQLRMALESLASGYDAILLDCPPNITLLSENVFRASDIILIPVIPTVLSQRTFEQLVGFFADKDLDTATLRPFFSMVQGRSKLHRRTMEELSASHPEFLKTAIPFSVEVEKMGERRMPLLAYSNKGSASLAYRSLCNEILNIGLP